MSLFEKKLSDVTAEDLVALIEGGVAESRIVDYKLETAGKSDSQRQEFLADVTSFANGVGGHLILGVSEKSGMPVEVVGLDCDDPDSEILRLEQMIRTGTRPVLQGIESVAIPLISGRTAIVLRIPGSWLAPHQIGQAGSFRFFGRGSNGKFPLDVDALRQLFRQGPELSERIANFRAKRLMAIQAGDLPFQLEGTSLIVCHIIPVTNFATGALVDLKSLNPYGSEIGSLLEHGASTRFNLDGAVAASEFQTGLVREYAQLFRDGSIEFVSYTPAWPVDGQDFLPGTEFDEEMVRLFEKVRDLHRTLGVSGTVAAANSLIGMKGWRIGAGRALRSEARFLDRDQIICPDVIIESLEGDIPTLIRPILDIVWNAGGFARSQNYDAQGSWSPRN